MPLTIALGIIHSAGRILMGKRKENDPLINVFIEEIKKKDIIPDPTGGGRTIKAEFISEFTWTFPGGELKTEQTEMELKDFIKQQTNLNVNIKHLIYEDDSGLLGKDIKVLFFDCEMVSQSAEAGEDLEELKWVPATEFGKHSIIPLDIKIKNFLSKLEKEEI